MHSIRFPVSFWYPISPPKSAIFSNSPKFFADSIERAAFNAGASGISPDFTLPKEPIAAAGMTRREITLQPFGTTAFRVSMFGVGK